MQIINRRDVKDGKGIPAGRRWLMSQCRTGSWNPILTVPGLALIILVFHCHSAQAYDPYNIVLKSPSLSTKERAWEMRHDGNVFLMFQKENRALQIGWYRHAPITLRDGAATTVIMYKYMWPGSVWTAKKNGVIYREINGKMKPSGTYAKREVVLGGRRQSVEMEKIQEKDAPWTVNIDGREYEEGANGVLKQTGWKEYREVTLITGKQAALLMSRGLEEHAKWTGKRDGVTYKDP